MAFRLCQGHAWHGLGDAISPTIAMATMRGREAGSGQGECGREGQQGISDLVRFITFHFLPLWGTSA